MVKKESSEIASAILKLAESRNRSLFESRLQRANKIMDWGNLVFGGLVITQAFIEKYNFELAFVGVLIFAGAYLYAYLLTEGGGKK